MADATVQLSTALAGRYTVERQLGAGGMATVYLAHDLKHDRHVALKVLLPELAAILGADRFLNEIKVTANLQHPNILPLYDSGRAADRQNGGGEFLYYVMPFVEGETLRTRLAREKQLDVDEAIEIAKQVAAALQHAHGRGVVHRDIKPENILFQGGQAVVADFGIALAVSQAGGTRLTETGLSLGTPHYMSPEQATGDRELDARSDVYSLGAVLYEMLVGEPPHLGNSVQAVIAKILTTRPESVRAQRNTVPAHVDAAVAKALAKLPADRFATALQFVEALANPAFTLATPGLAPAVPPAAERWKPLALGSAVVTIVALAVAAWGWLRTPPEPTAAVTRYRLALPLEVGLGNDFGSNLALSPDGTRLVYASAVNGVPHLWMLERHRLEPALIPGTEQAHQPFFSPDGRRVGFVTWDRRLKIVSLGGEPPTTLLDSGLVRGGGSWGTDGYIYLSAGSRATGLDPRGLLRVAAVGGTIESVTTLDTTRHEVAHWFPEALPGGRGVIFGVARDRLYDAAAVEVAVVDLKTRIHRPLIKGVMARWSPTGHLLVVRADGALVAAPFDLNRLELTGPATPLLEGIEVEGLGTADIVLSAGGTLMYAPGGTAAAAFEAVWVTRAGQATPIDPGWTGRLRYPVLSPDGKRLAVTLGDREEQVWIKQLERGPLSKLTFEGTGNTRPAWRPGGREVSFIAQVGSGQDAYVKRADGSAQAELLLDPGSVPVQEIEWSRDGRWMVVRLNSQPMGDLHAWRPGVDSAPAPLVTTGFDEVQPALSPDGRWLAYASNESGRYEVYVRPFPDASAAKWQVSTNGGEQPLWAHSGRELFYKDGENQLVAVEVLSSAPFALGGRKVLFSTVEFGGGGGHRTYDITADDRRFVMIRPVTTGEQPVIELIVVDNFFTELRQKVRKN